MKRSLPLALCLGASLFVGSAYADHEGKKHTSAELKTGKQCSAVHLLGARVNDSQGQKIGKIEDLVIDPSSRRVEFAVIRLESDLAKGKAFTPIPMTALRPDTTAAGQPGMFVLTADRAKLMSASRFNVERWPADQTTIVWGPEVYSHYGMSYDASVGGTGAEVQVHAGTDSGLEYKENLAPTVDYRAKSPDNGTAPDGKGTFPYLHEQTDRD